MKIYAIRDRLIDYFMQPFVGPDDKNVQAAVARTINQGEMTSDISQAPHHFEIWSLAQVTEDGHIVEDRYLIQDCAALVRGGVRPAGNAGDPEAPGAEIIRRHPPERITGGNGADPSPLQGAARAASGEASQGGRSHPGSP